MLERVRVPALLQLHQQGSSKLAGIPLDVNKEDIWENLN